MEYNSRMGDLQKSCEKVEISGKKCEKTIASFYEEFNYLDTEKNPQSSTIETTQKPVVVTESMIRLNRRFNYATRPRPNAIAIVNPETKEVLFPGQLKAAQAEKIPETESPKAGASIEASDCSRRDSESRK